jgi:hypothetical protein
MPWFGILQLDEINYLDSWIDEHPFVLHPFYLYPKVLVNKCGLCDSENNRIIESLFILVILLC